MNELDQIVEMMIANGESPEAIEQVIAEYESQQSPDSGETQESGVFQQEQPQDAEVPQQETEQPYEPNWAEIKRKNDKDEELTEDEHNAQADALAESYASYTRNVPGQAPVPPEILKYTAAFSQGIASLASGSIKAVKASMLWAKEKFNPEFAKEVQENPEVRKQYMESITDADASIDDTADKLGLLTKRHGSQSISELVAEGRLGDAGQVAGQNIAQAVPSLLAVMTGYGGMAVLGASSVGSSFEEDLERHPEESIDKLYGAALAKGGTEFISELATRGILKRSGLLLGKTQSVNAAKEFTAGALSRIVKDASIEGFSEGITDTASKAIDYMVYGDETDARSILTGFIDNAIVGAALGGGVASIGAVNSKSTMERAAAAEVLKSNETSQIEKEAEEKINAAEAQKQKIKEKTAQDQSLTEQEQENSLLNEVLNQEIQEQIRKVEEAKRADREALEDMTEAEITRLAKAKDRARKARKAAKKETDSDKKSILENVARESESQVSEVYDTVRNHENLVNQQEVVDSEADAVIEKQQAIIKEEQKLDEPKNEKIEAAQEEIAVQQAKKNQAAKVVEEARPGYDHNLKRTRQKKESTQELTEKYQAARESKNKPRADKYFARIMKNESSLIGKATSYAFNNLTQQGGRQTIDGKALTREDVRKYVEDQFTQDIREGREPSMYNLVQRAKRKTLAEYLPKKTYSKKNLTKAEKARFAKQEQTELEARAAIAPEETRLAQMERELADVKTSRKRKRELEPQVEALRDQVANAKAVAADAGVVSLDAATNAEGEGTIADFVKDETGQVDSKVTPVEQIAKAVPMNTDAVQEAVREVLDLGGVDIKSPSAIEDVASDPVVSSQVDSAIEPMTKSKKAILDNASTVIDMLPEAFKTKRAIESKADLDAFISGANQSRALGQVRKAMKAGIVEGFVEQAAKDGDGIDMTEYMETTKTDKKAAVQSMVMHLNRMYPGMRFFLSKKAMVNKLLDDGQIQAAGNIDNIGGFLTPDGAIYMNPDLVTMETPIHELGHVWAKGIKQSNPALYLKGVELVKKTGEWQELVMKSKDPDSVYYNYSDARLEEEGIATLIGVHGNMKFGNAQTATEARNWIQQVMDYISEKIGFTVNKDTTLRDFLDHAVNEIVAGKATNPSKVFVTDFMDVIDIVKGDKSIDRALSGNQLPMHKVTAQGRTFTFAASEADAAKIRRMLSSQEGTVEFSEVADSQLDRLKKDLARVERAPQRLGDRTAEILRRRIGQLERASLPKATKLADMMMLNPVLKNAIRAAKPVDQKRYRTVNNDLQARKTVAGVMKVMSALPAAGRVEFANQLQRGIKSNTLAGLENVAGFQNSIIAKEILTEAGIDYDGIDMSNNLLIGVAQAMNKQNVRGVFGENVNWAKVDYKGTDAANIEANKGAIKAFFNTLAGLNKLGQIDGQTINKIQNIWGAAGQHSLYRGATGEPKFFHKGAKLGTKKAQKGYVREHVLPASEFFDRAFNAARQGKLEGELGNLLDNYQLVLLSQADDARVNGAGFKTRQPDVFGQFKGQKLGELPASYMRYFNGKVAINPTDYVDANGRTMASYMGISPEAQESLQSSGIEGIEFSESKAVNEATAKNAEKDNANRKSLEKKILKRLKDRYVYKTPGDYKHSKIPQKTREILEATLKDFNLRKDQLTNEQLSKLDGAIENVVQQGTNAVKSYRKAAKADKARTQQVVDNLIKENTDLDPQTLTSNKAKRLVERKNSFIKRLGRRFSLAPSTNNDFYGLLYNLYPKGARRSDAKQFVDEKLIKPLEDGNIKYAAKTYEMRVAFANALNNTDFKKIRDKDSQIEVDGEVLTNDQVVKVYNYIKDPSTYKQLEASKIDINKMQEIADYVAGDPQIKAYADQIANIYQSVAPDINATLERHGRETFSNVKINQSEMTPEQIEVLNTVYDGEIPEIATYTPLTAEGADNAADVENLMKEGNYSMYTVMDGRLKRRTGGGDINLTSSTTEQDMTRYMDGPIRTYAFMDFAAGASNFFGPKQMKAMEAGFGTEWSGSMKDVLRRIVTGKTNPNTQPETVREVNKWVNRTVAGVMFLNLRSAILQQVSITNFLAEDPSITMKGWKSKNKGKVKEFLKNSPWFKQRGEGKVDVAIEEMFSQRNKNWIDTLLEKGYKFTKFGDKHAILNGGAPFMTGKFDQYVKDGLSEEAAMQEAYKDFVRQAEETQQSTRQERLGREQTTGVGKLLLAFANTQQQYNRKMWKAAKDIAAGENVAKNVRTILYYGGIQNVMFNSAQKLMFLGLGLNDKKEEENAATWANSIADTILRGIGVWGALAASAKNAMIAALKADERGPGKKVMEALINTSPAIGTKIRNIETMLNARPIYAQSEMMDDLDEETALMLYRAAAGGNALFNLPTDRALKLVEQASDVMASDLDEIQRLARLGGWSRYDVGETAGSGPLKKIVEVEDSDPQVLGRANKDGSIEINPNLSPAQRKEVLAHEGQHAKDMKSGKLDYTDNYVKWGKKKYDRKGDKIYYNGKWRVEGDKSLPWEQIADKAEAKESPLKASRGARKAAQNEATKAAHAQARADRSAEWDRQRSEENVGWGDVAMKAAGAIPAAGALAGAGRVGKLVQKVGSKVGAGNKYLGYADQAVEQLFGEGADGSTVGGTTKAKAKKKAAELLAKGVVKDAAEAARIAAKSLGIVGIGMAAYDAAQLANQKMRQDMTDEEYANFKRTGSTTGSRRGSRRPSPTTYTGKAKPGSKEWEEAKEEEIRFNRDWYSNPETRAMLESQAPRFKGKVDKYLDRMGEANVHHATHLEPGEVAEYWRDRDEHGHTTHQVGIGPEHSTTDKGLVAHEMTHVAGWDYDLGKKVLEETGGPDTSTRFGKYLSNPDEAYANLQELRRVLDLSPDQRDLTPEELQKLVDEKGNEDTKAYIKAFGIEGTARAHNKVADAEFNNSFNEMLADKSRGLVS